MSEATPAEPTPSLPKQPAEKKKLKVLQANPIGSLDAEGHREFVQTADVHGRFTRARGVVFTILGAILIALPWIRIDGHPSLFLDVPARRFYLFGHVYNAQDFWLAWFLASAVLLTLLGVTTVLGRVWCGWACPQTVFLEGVFRRIERLVEGPRNERLRLDAGPRDARWMGKKAIKHALYIVSAIVISHAFLAYFVSIPSLFEMVRRSPAEHPTAFAWMAVVSTLLYGNFSWFREQLCLVICPYGRLQSILTDDDTMVVGYDQKRGEPRGKGKDRSSLGACVDCGRCVAVCPTAIDIRNGLQLDCVACTQCIDACDEVMDKLKQPRGLIRYDSLRGLRHEPRRVFRPRLVFYGFVAAVWIGIAAFAFRSRQPVEVQILRMRGAPYVVDGDTVRNTFELHVINKEDHPAHVDLTATVPDGAQVTMPTSLDLTPLESRPIVVVVTIPRASLHRGDQVVVHARENEEREDAASEESESGPEVYETDEHAPLLGPM